MTDRTAAQILADHANRFNGGRRLVLADLTTQERANLERANLVGANLERAYLVGANLVGANLERAYLGGAYLGDANLVGANLGDANLERAYLGGAYLGDANLVGANLRGANLERANLVGANLERANLGGANLGGAYLSRGLAIVQGPTRSDGYYFSLRACCLGEHVVVAGCRSFTIEQYRQHIAANYPNTSKADETLAILDFLQVRLDQIFAGWSKS